MAKNQMCAPERKSHRVSVKDAAREIGCAPEYLRRQMKAKKWDLGQVVNPGRSSKNYQYFVFRAKLNKFTGNEEVKRREKNQ